PLSPIKRIVVVGSLDQGPDARYAHVKVSDTGGGIAPEDRSSVFIPFFTTKSRGYGIGLALVQKILVGHGGEVTVERSDASGTVFHCRLPLLSPNSPMKLREHAVAQSYIIITGSKLRHCNLSRRSRFQ